MHVTCDWRHAAPKIIKDGSYWQLDPAVFFSDRLRLAEKDGRVKEYIYDRLLELYRSKSDDKDDSSVIRIMENSTFERRFVKSGVVEIFDADGKFITSTTPTLSHTNETLYHFKPSYHAPKNGKDSYLSINSDDKTAAAMSVEKGVR